MEKCDIEKGQLYEAEIIGAKRTATSPGGFNLG